MKNNIKKQREERLQKIFDFDEYFDKKQEQYKVLPCLYISLKNKVYKSFVLFHKAALVIRVGLNPKECIIFDKLYFTLFWVKILYLEVKTMKMKWVLRIKMSDTRIIQLEFEESPIVQIENLLGNHLKHPILLLLSTEFFELKIKQKNDQKILKNKPQQIKEQIQTDSEKEDNDSELNKSLEKVYKRRKTSVISKANKNFLKKFIHSEIKSIDNENDMQSLGLRIFQNQNYNFCSSYPQNIIIPIQVLPKHIKEIVKFRVKQRLPILSFINKNQKFLFRSSQIQTGVFSKRCKEDEMLLFFIGDTQKKIQSDYYLKFSGSFVKQNPNLLICDARSKAAALGNKIMGKGYENQTFYTNTNLTFHNIANLDQVRNSYQKIWEKKNQIKQTPNGFYKTLGESEWYDYIQDLLEFSLQIAEYLNKGNFNVLLHCSDGWDRTSQVSALVQILLDKQFRTLQGFLDLIIKEFSEAGFNFSKRIDLKEV